MIFAAILIGCVGSGKVAGADTADTPDRSSAETGDTDTTPMAPCADGSWGSITDPIAAIHLRLDGDDSADGTLVNPVATVARAVELARRAGADQEIAVGPGRFDTALDLAELGGDGTTDQGLRIAGCSPAETTLFRDATGAVLRISEVTGVSVAGLAIEGGRPGVWVWAGAELTLDDVRIVSSQRLGILVDGPETIVTAISTEVVDVVVEIDGDSEIGYGIQIADGSMLATDLVVDGAVGVGVLVHGGSIDAEGISVRDTGARANGTLGRGMQVQAYGVASIRDGILSGNSDAAIYGHEAIRFDITDTNIDATAAAAIPETSSTSGDGIVISQAEGATTDPASFVSTITGTTVTGSSRAGILFADVTGVVSGNTTGAGNGLVINETSIFAQGAASVSGTDPVVTLDGSVGYATLELFKVELEADAP